jgi:tetratricopeptide (TPR) repeat protein
MSGLHTTLHPAATGPGLDEWWAMLHRGTVLLKHKEYRQALSEFERVITLDTESVYASIAHHMRGYAYLQLLELQAALEDFQRASLLWPAYIISGVLAEWLEMAMWVDRKRDERLHHAERLETRALLATDDAQQHGRAQYYLDLALRIEPDWPACFWVGLVLAARNEPERAQEALCRARLLAIPPRSQVRSTG